MKKQPKNIGKGEVAYFFAEGEGMSSYRCKTKEQALKAMQELWNDDIEYSKENYGEQEITLEHIKEVRYYTHKRCGNMTFDDDNMCWECGEPCGTTGRKTFVIYFI